MILKVSKRRHRQLTTAASYAGSDPALARRIRGEYSDREHRELVRGGYADASSADTASMDRAKAKRERKAAKVARINPDCFAA